MRILLGVSALIEFVAGLAIMTAPSPTARLLLGTPLEGPSAAAVAGVAGAALLALAVACGLAWGDEHGMAAGRVVAAMLVYNLAVTAVLVSSGLGPPPHGVALWPAVLLHAALAVWCVACLRGRATGPSRV
ncbi:MAG: hypothetical protein ACHQ52_05775 [Candidatus Eisenbacteria bacterium]